MIDDFTIKASKNTLDSFGVEIVDYVYFVNKDNSFEKHYYLKIKYEDFYFYLGLTIDHRCDFTIKDLCEFYIEEHIKSFNGPGLDRGKLGFFIEEQCLCKATLDNRALMSYNLYKHSSLVGEFCLKYSHPKAFMKDIDSLDMKSVFSIAQV